MASESVADADDWRRLSANADAAVSTLLKLSNAGDGRQLFESKQIYLTIGLRRVPKPGACGTVLLQLAECPHSDTDSCCLVTKDLERDPADYEASAAHFSQLVRACGWRRQATVLPLRELTVAYMPHEAKRRLCNSFDFFLADRRVAHRLGNKLGKHFALKQRRKLPLPVDLESRDLRSELERGSRTVRLCLSGSTVSCLLGSADMPAEALRANVLAACQQLARKLPGGVGNVSGLYLRHCACGNVPLYAAAAAAAPSSETETETQKLETTPGKRAKVSLSATLRQLRSQLWDPSLVRLPSAKPRPKRLAAAKAKGRRRNRPAKAKAKTKAKAKATE